MTQQITPAPTVPGTCNQCLYWQPLEVGGYCHYHAPSHDPGRGMDGRAIWPRTLPTDWCGQWQQAALPREMQAVI